ncbi:MAG: hypothetical protein AAGA46_00235 [Cyanobacteria bacterium P01_F01_bin.13]
MPASKRPQITLDDTTWKRLNVLVERSAHLDVNSVLRDCISRGLNAAEAEVYNSENKELINQKLKQRQGKMAQALEEIKQIVADLPDLASQIDIEPFQKAIADIEKGLSD